MQTIPNVATSDGYVDACTLGPDPLATQLVYVVANAGVIAQFRPVSADGTVQDFGPEVLITPTANTVQRCAGARFRSAVAGTPARIVAQLLEPSDPQFGGGVPFASTLAASGGLTPGVASVQVEKDGVLIGQEAALNLIGTRWAIADNGALGRIDITPSSGLELIADQVLLASASSVTFSSIPATFKHLRLLINARLDIAATILFCSLQFNGDTGLNYLGEHLVGVGASAVASDNGTLGWARFGVVPGANAPASTAALNDILIGDYASTTFLKALNALVANATQVATQGEVRAVSARWNSAAAINAIKLSPFDNPSNFVAGSRFTLYGLA